MAEEQSQAPAAEAQGTSTENAAPAESTVVDETTGETLATTTYANGKFKSVSDLENAYGELQSSYSKKLGGFDGAPEEYTLNEGFEANATVEALQAWGAENQLSNDGLNGVLEILNTTQAKEAEEYATAQRESLGKDADARIQNAADWVRANLGEEAVAAIDSMWVGAQGIETIEKIMKMANSGATPANVNVAPALDADKVKAMRFAEDEFGNRRMSTDPSYRAKVLAAEAQLLNA